MHLPREPRAFVQHRLKTCSKLTQMELMNTPGRGLQTNYAQAHEPECLIEVRLLHNLQRRLRKLLRVIHLKCSHAKFVTSGWQIGVVRHSFCSGFAPVPVETIELVAEANALLGA